MAALRAGLLRVVPQAVLDLLTWQQLERKVCGNPELTVDNVKAFSKCQGWCEAAHTLPCAEQRGRAAALCTGHPT